MSKDIKPLQEAVEPQQEETMSKEEKRTIGTKLTLKKNGTDAADIVIAYLTSIGEIGLESEEMDVTSLDSVGDFKEYIAGTKDAGEISIAGWLFDSVTFEKLLSLANTREMREWEVLYPSGATWSFSAFVKSLKDGEKTPDGVSSFTGNLRVSGAPTFKAAA